eukprot:2525245-Lingulodinium_polyedra.AAC.1
MKHRELLRGPVGIQTNFSFTPCSVNRALRAAAEARKAQWHFTDADIDEFTDMVGKRIRTICRQVAVAEGRRNQPKWVAALLNEAVVEPAAG